MRLKKKHRRLLIDILIIIIIIASICIAYIAAQFFLATSTPFVAIVSGSMSPALEVGDLIIVHGIPPRDIKVGDIIIFDSPTDSRTVHRVIRTQTLINGTIQFKTKGDANPSEDNYWTSEQRIHGIVMYRIPYLGWLSIEPAIPIAIVIVLTIIIILWPKRIRKHRRKSSLAHASF